MTLNVAAWSLASVPSMTMSGFLRRQHQKQQQPEHTAAALKRPAAKIAVPVTFELPPLPKFPPPNVGNKVLSLVGFLVGDSVGDAVGKYVGAIVGVFVGGDVLG